MNARILSLAALLTGLVLSSCTPAPAAPPKVPTPTQLPATSTPVPPTATSTPTRIPPAVSVSEPVECTSGPGPGYSVLATLEPGEPARVVGQDAAGVYWIVLEPQGWKGCWVQRELASLEGDAWGLPELIPGPTQQSTPNAPANLKAVTSCSQKRRGQGTGLWSNYSYEVTITLSWEDRSANETGFELQRNRAPYLTLAPDTVTLKDSLTFNYRVSGAMIYWLRAVNENGRSTRVEVIAAYRC